MSKPKIFHIGGVDSPHVMGIIEQVNKYSDYEQIIMSYPCNPIDKPLLNAANVTVYVYNYKDFFRWPRQRHDVTRLKSWLTKVLRKEKPDIIHGHYLSQCAAPMYHAMLISKRPGIVVPWSTWDIQEDPILFGNNKRCIDLCSYVSVIHSEFLHKCLSAYGAPISKGLCSGPPVRLASYKDAVPDVASPRIYVPRNYYQDLIFSALSEVVKEYPNTQITALSSASTQNFVASIGLINVTFLPGMLSQAEFSEMIRKHNIIMSLAPDSGMSGTTMQSAYFGAVTISHKSPWAKEFFTDETNFLTCDLTVASIRDRVIYAIKNLPELCDRFKKNNAFLAQHDSEITGQTLMGAYETLLPRV